MPAAAAENGADAAAPHLIHAKFFIPRPQANGVPRPRLLERLSQGVQGQLTLLSAPAGSGKTTLLAEWIASGEVSAGHIAWLTLDARDNDPHRLLQYLWAALGRMVTDLPQPPPASPDSALTVLLNAASRISQPIILILDDFDTLNAPEAELLVQNLLRQQPPALHLVIASRTEPRLPLAQLRTRNQLTELRGEDLRFTHAEIRSFFQLRMHRELPEETLSLLESRTEGWVTGLQMASLTMHHSSTPAEMAQTFSGSHRYVMDYLAEQVLEQQTDDTQEFLLQTSILERLSVPLCRAVTGSPLAPAMLEYLERANLFLLPLDEHRTWYRYHALFADFLRQRAASQIPFQLPELHRRAMEWYERNGYTAEAVDHALAMGDPLAAIRLMEQVTETIWMRGDMVRLLGWLEALPPSVIRSHPGLCIFHAWILNITGDFQATARRIAEAETCLATQDDLSESERRHLRGMLDATRAITHIMDNEADQVIALCTAALQALPPEDHIWRSVVERNLANAHLLMGQTSAAIQRLEEAFAISRRAGNMYMTLVSLYEIGEIELLCGRLEQAEETFRYGIRLGESAPVPNLSVQGACCLGLAKLLLERNELPEAHHCALTAVQKAEAGRSVGMRLAGYTLLGLIDQAQGNEASASRYFEQALRVEPWHSRTSLLYNRDMAARLWQRQPDAALEKWLHDRGLQENTEATYYNEAGLLALARLRLRRKEPAAALALLQRMQLAAQAGERRARLAEIFTLQAAALYQRNELLPALQALERALRLAAPRRMLRMFLEPAGEIAALLPLLQKQNHLHEALRSFLEEILTAFPAPQAEAHRGNGKVSLSERELAILQQIAAGCTSRQIAVDLALSVSTVHWHIKNMYSKMHVHSRTQAVARARQLGMLE